MFTDEQKKAFAAKIEGTIEQVESGLQCLRSKEPYEADRAFWRILDGLGDIAAFYPGTQGVTEPTGKGFKLDLTHYLRTACPSEHGQGVSLDPSLYPETKLWGVARHVVKYAYDHYNEGGWDMLVECKSNEEIMLACVGITSPEEAIQRCATEFGLEIWDERRKEIQAEADY